MISPDEALDLVIRTATPLAPRAAKLEDACGLVLAEDIAADSDYPPFDRSMMDGFAVRVADAGRTVPIVGEVAAGSMWNEDVNVGQCVEILTGAPCPPGAEAVVPKENVKRQGNSVTLPGVIKPGQNIASKGSDCRVGERVLSTGQIISGMAIGTIAAFGRASVSVVPRPSLGIITTGAELAPPGEPLLPGCIRNSNGPMLAAMGRELRLSPLRQWHVPDDLQATMRALEEAADMDIIVLSGGVSVGTYDFVPEALARLGAETIFHGVNQKPGKPILFARRERGKGDSHLLCEAPGGPFRQKVAVTFSSQMIFGLPGNPLSCHFGFHRYVAAAARKMSGRPAAPQVFRGALTQTLESKGGRTRYLPAIAERGADTAAPWRIELLPDRSSADIFQSCRANCYVEIPPDNRPYQIGDVISFAWITEGPQRGS